MSEPSYEALVQRAAAQEWRSGVDTRFTFNRAAPANFDPHIALAISLDEGPPGHWSRLTHAADLIRPCAAALPSPSIGTSDASSGQRNPSSGFSDRLTAHRPKPAQVPHVARR